jgi:anti-anti-sigma regulatory factor
MPVLRPVFAVTERRGGILVLAPRGDAVSFREDDFDREIGELSERIGALERPLVAVDFGSADYFGSIVIGAVIKFGTLSRERGGQLVMCNASKTMHSAFDLMRLEERWQILGTLKEAVKALKKA